MESGRALSCRPPPGRWPPPWRHPRAAGPDL